VPVTVPPTAIRVSVLIVSWNARDCLARCLHTLDRTPHEVIVVDNASQDGSADLVRRDFPAVRLIASTRNLGFAGGVNLARREASAPRLLLLNPDAEAAPGAIDRLADVLDAEPGAAAVAGRLVNADGSPQEGFNVRRLPTLASLVFDLLFIDHLWPGNPVTSRYYARDLDPDSSAEVEQPAAACMMVRAEVFDRLGGMDERFHPAWFEDVDFCLRMREAGHRIRYEPAAGFVHRGGVARDALGPRAFSRTFHANMVRYVHKHHGAAAALVIRGLIAAGALPRALARRLGGGRDR
jgi:N-acetylglucosaminyl-diphospho-decaprenol L-rhamnosyltransferase